MKNSSRPNRAKATETRDRAGFSRPFLLQPPPLKRGALQGRAPPVVEAPRHGGTERALRHRYARLYHAHDKPHRSPPLPLPRRCARPRSGAETRARGTGEGRRWRALSAISRDRELRLRRRASEDRRLFDRRRLRAARRDGRDDGLCACQRRQRRRDPSRRRNAGVARSRETGTRRPAAAHQPPPL